MDRGGRSRHREEMEGGKGMCKRVRGTEGWRRGDGGTEGGGERISPLSSNRILSGFMSL